MALKKTNTTPAFEQEPTVDNTAEVASAPAKTLAKSVESVSEQVLSAVESATAVKQEPEPETRQVDPGVTASLAIAKASSTSLAVADAAAQAKQFQREVQDMKGASDFSHGNYRVFKGNNGEIAEGAGDQESLGRWAKVRLLSWDDHFEISPGETGASTKEFVAYSKDGKVIDSVIGEEQRTWVGKPVGDYLNYLKTEEEFANSKTRRFVDMAVALMASDSGEGPIGQVVQVTLSESSIPAFSRYQQSLQDTARCVAMGLPGFALPADPFTFFMIREVAKKGSNAWTKLKIEANLPAKL